MADFVEAHDEPLHRRRFENRWVRVFDVQIPSEVTSLFHRHSRDTLYVSIDAATVSEQTLGDEPTDAFDIPAGIATCRKHAADPLIHRLSNVGATTMRMIGLEAKEQPSVCSTQPISAPSHRLFLEEDRFRAYRLSLAPRTNTSEVEYRFSGALVALTAGCVSLADTDVSRTISCEAGTVIWHDGPSVQTIANVGEDNFVAILIEWR